MASLKRTVLGIEIGTREIRMVEMRGGNPPQILRVGSVGMLPGAMDGDRIVQVEGVGELIRRLHTQLGCQSRTVVVGMGIHGIVSRVLDIPRVPESELRIVLEGELAHYQILRAGAGAFDHFRLNASRPGDEGLQSVLVMATEQRIADDYRQAVERAGLQVLALEPVSLSLFRAAYPLLQSEPASLCLAVTPQRSELSILDHGEIRIYRRVDMGSNDFIRGRKPPPSSLPGASLDLSFEPGNAPREARPTRTLLNMDSEDDTDELETGDLRSGFGRRGGTGSLNIPQDTGGKPGEVILQAANALSNEVQRSIDYYRREFPDATAITRILLSANDPEAAAVAPLLSQALNIEVRVVEPPLDGALPPQTLSMLGAPQGLQYLAAMGLALHALTPEAKNVPHFDLSTAGKSSAQPVLNDRLTAVMLTAACILLGGLFLGFIIQRNADSENDRLTEIRKRLQIDQQDFARLDKQINDEKALGWIIKSDNLPVPAILDQITREMPSGVGLKNLNIQRDGQIVVEGSARDLQEFDVYYLNLKTCPRFVAMRLQSTTTDPTSRIVTFHIEMALKGTQAAVRGESSAL